MKTDISDGDGMCLLPSREPKTVILVVGNVPFSDVRLASLLERHELAHPGEEPIERVYVVSKLSEFKNPLVRPAVLHLPELPESSAPPGRLDPRNRWWEHRRRLRGSP